MYLPGKGQAFFSILNITAALVSLWLCACTPTTPKIKPVVTTVPPVNSGKPRIQGLLDLGMFEVQEGQQDIAIEGSDEFFTPGEWLQLEGKNLGVSSVQVDDLTVPVEFYLANKIFIKVPKGLKPRNQHTLTVTSEYGKAETHFRSAHYFLATDLDGKQVRYLRTSDDKKGVEKKWQPLPGDFKRPMFVLMDNSSRFAFVVDVHEDAEELYEDLKSYELHLHTYDLSAPLEPQRVASSSVVLGSALSDAVLSSSGQVLLLGKQTFVLLDASNPKNLQLLGRNRLKLNGDISRTAYIDAIFFNDDRSIAVLETYSNTVTVFNNAVEEGFPLVARHNFLPEKAIPLSVDLEPDPADKLSFWVLQSPNFRLTGDKFNELYRKLFKKEKFGENKATLAQLERYSLQGKQLVQQKVIPLQAGSVGYFIAPARDGGLFVSMSRTGILDIDFDNGNRTEMLKNVKNMFWGSIAFGQIAKVDTNTSEVSSFLKGVGIYYHVLDAPDFGPVFSLLKFGPSFSFPYLAPSWGVGINGVGTYALRKMDSHAIFPPYFVGNVAFQY